MLASTALSLSAFSTQSVPDATKMYTEKVGFVQKSLEELQATIMRKEDNLRVVRDVLQVVSRAKRYLVVCNTS